jgi:membrane protease YdiL (CAAX protease family)
MSLDVSRELRNFFILTFAISWIIWFLAPLIALGDILVFLLICTIGAFGPSISAVIIASQIDKVHVDNSKKKMWLLFTITLIVSIISGFVVVFFAEGQITFFLIIVLIIAATIAAFLISRIYSSNQGISNLLQPLKGVKKKQWFLLVAFFLPFLFALGAILVFIIGGGSIPSDFNFVLSFFVLLIGYPFMFFYGGPLNEEIGWRGFATPHLQEKSSPLITGIIIGIIWSLWHAPLHFNGFYGDGWSGFLLRFVWNVPLCIIFTWYYNKSDGNLLGAIFLHASINAFLNFAYFVPVIIYGIFFIITAIFLIFYEKMWKNIPPIKKN